MTHGVLVTVLYVVHWGVEVGVTVAQSGNSVKVFVITVV